MVNDNIFLWEQHKNESLRLKFYKRSTEKFGSRIDPEGFSASGSRVIFPVACHLRLKASTTKRGEEFHLIERKTTMLIVSSRATYCSVIVDLIKQLFPNEEPLFYSSPVIHTNSIEGKSVFYKEEL